MVAGMMYPMLDAPSTPWNATPTTFPLLTAGPPELPGLIAASTVTIRFDSWPWVYSPQSTRDTTPEVMEMPSPPIG